MNPTKVIAVSVVIILSAAFIHFILIPLFLDDGGTLTGKVISVSNGGWSEPGLDLMTNDSVEHALGLHDSSVAAVFLNHIGSFVTVGLRLNGATVKWYYFYAE